MMVISGQRVAIIQVSAKGIAKVLTCHQQALSSRYPPRRVPALELPKWFWVDVADLRDLSSICKEDVNLPVWSVRHHWQLHADLRDYCSCQNLNYIQRG